MKKTSVCIMIIVIIYAVVTGIAVFFEIGEDNAKATFTPKEYEIVSIDNSHANSIILAQSMINNYQFEVPKFVANDLAVGEKLIIADNTSSEFSYEPTYKIEDCKINLISSTYQAENSKYDTDNIFGLIKVLLACLLPMSIGIIVYFKYEENLE